MVSFWDQFDCFVNFINAKKNPIMVGFFIILIVSSGLLWNHHHKIKINEHAFESYQKIAKVANAYVDTEGKSREEKGMLYFSSSDKKYSKLLSLSEAFFQDHGRSNYGPYFLAYKAEALRNLEQHGLALKEQERAVSLMKKNVIRDLHEEKLNVMRIESEDSAVREKGIEGLKKMVSESISPADRFALFRLHQYFWRISDYPEAINFGAEYISRYGEPGKSSLPDGMNDSDFLSIVKFNMRLVAAK
jgi:tetratricopeptide (TPR) repeat protein